MSSEYVIIEEIKKLNDKIDLLLTRQHSEYLFNEEKFSTIPEPCRNCSNHPSNGGSGICHCTLGTPKITC